MERFNTVGDLFPTFSEHLGNVDQKARDRRNSSDYDVIHNDIDSTRNGRIDGIYARAFFKDINWDEPDNVIQDVQGPIQSVLGGVMVGRSGDQLSTEDCNNFGKTFLSYGQNDFTDTGNHNNMEIADVSYPITHPQMLRVSHNAEVKLYHPENLQLYLEKAIESIEEKSYVKEQDYPEIMNDEETDVGAFLREGKDSLMNDMEELSTPLNIDEGSLGGYNHRENLLQTAEEFEGQTAIPTYDKRLLREWLSGEYETVSVYTPKLLETAIICDNINN